MPRNIFLTGAPSSGKTTVIKKIINRLGKNMTGFYTEEEKKEDRRVGFLMKTLDGKKAYLAHENIESDVRIRRYKVSLENIETIAIPSIKPRPDMIIILDEIGKMECFSESFRRTALEALDSPNLVIGTITLGGGEFIQSIKEREDIEIIEVTPENRDGLPDLIIQKINSEHKS